MSLTVRHNLLYATAQSLQAELAIARFLPTAQTWRAEDVVVGDTARLPHLSAQMSWPQEVVAPQPDISGRALDLFGLPQAVTAYIDGREGGGAVLQIAINSALLDALPGQFLAPTTADGDAPEGHLWLGISPAPTWLSYRLAIGQPDPAATLAIGVAAQALWQLYRGEQLHLAASAPDSVDTEELALPELDVGDDADHWEMLNHLLDGQLRALPQAAPHAPIGRWLADTVLLVALDCCDGVARRTARVLGLPDTTLRRQVERAQRNANNPFFPVSNAWATSLPALEQLLRAIVQGAAESSDLAQRTQTTLLALVRDHVGSDRARGAALMGITPPTYTRWLRRYIVDRHDPSRSPQEAIG
ncbi:MAG: hypothetical protein AAF515_02195 [Pseudomonadota bacterium]